MEFNEKLIRLRKARRMTQDELARQVGVSRQSVYKWECGQSYPEAMKLVALRELFDISIDQLLDPAFEVEGPLRYSRRPAGSRPAIARKESGEPPAEKVAERPAFDRPESAHAAEPPHPADTHAPPARPIDESEPQTPDRESRKERKPGFFARIFGRR